MRSADDLELDLLGGLAPSVGRRLVLCPHGLPRREAAKEACMELLKHFGGDLDRVIEPGTASLDQFAHHVGRLWRIRHRQECPIILFTRTHPLDSVVIGARRKLESRVPFLGSGLWFIFCDLRENPSFVEALRRLGALDGNPEHAPIWTARGRMRFLVLTTTTYLEAG